MGEKKKKKRVPLFLLTLLFIIIYFALKFSTNVATVRPYPYILSLSPLSPEEITAIQNADILIVGDRMGSYLKNFISDLVKPVSRGLQSPVKVYVLANEHEGLHRTVAKLSQLKKIPKVIIYHGGSEEFYEHRFSVEKKNVIFENFNFFQNDYVSSLITIFPPISRLIYQNPDYLYLGDLVALDQIQYTDIQKQVQIEIGLLLYRFHLEDLYNLAKEHKSTLIMMTTPLNLEIAPKKICDNSTSPLIYNAQKKLEETLSSGQIKKSYLDLKKIKENTIGNARTFYLFGMAALRLGYITEAVESLQAASSFDCQTWRGNAVINNIIREIANNHHLMLFDFDDYMAQNLGQEGLFNDEIFPQNLFYQRGMGELATLIRKVYF
ncbi:MAG: hypothetical protein WCG27_02585 [Pseudomonadota bacterium]